MSQTDPQQSCRDPHCRSHRPDGTCDCPPPASIRYHENRLAGPYLTFDGEVTTMTEWVRSVEARLAALTGERRP
jgi:hypothetical protein